MLELVSLLQELEQAELVLLQLNPRAHPPMLVYSSLAQRRKNRPNLHLRLSVAINTLKRNLPPATISKILTMTISKTLKQANLAESQAQDLINSKISLIHSERNQTHSQIS